MLQQYLFLALLTVLVGSYSVELVFNAIDNQLQMQAIQLEAMKR